MPIINTIRLLGFGGVLGGLVTYLVYLYYPQIFPPNLDIYQIIMIGAGIGGISGKFIDTILVKTILYPLRKCITYYMSLWELTMQYKRGFISIEEFTFIKSVLDRQYFIGEDRSNNKQIEGK